jgi:hypothetical protein
VLTAVHPMSRIMSFASHGLPVPPGTERLGSIDHPTYPGRAGGELLRLASGHFVVRRADVYGSIPQDYVLDALRAAAEAALPKTLKPPCCAARSRVDVAGGRP